MTLSFPDPIYGQPIRFKHPIDQVIKTAEFQALRGKKQLGVCSIDSPSLVFTRFTHSLGVGFLAQRITQSLYVYLDESRPNGKLCVVLAALLHDIGHGPFSHVFDTYLEERLGKKDPRADHEKRSIRLIRRMWAKYDWSKWLSKNDLDFVCSIIVADLDWGKSHNVPPVFYQIVKNSKSGWDIDKLDYLLRDAYCANVHLKVQNVEPLISNLRVINGNLAHHVDKTIDISDCFYSRMYMHTRIYQKAQTKANERMLLQILEHVGPFLDIPGLNPDKEEDTHDWVFLRDDVLMENIRVAAKKNYSDIPENVHEIIDNFFAGNFWGDMDLRVMVSPNRKRKKRRGGTKRENQGEKAKKKPRTESEQNSGQQEGKVSGQSDSENPEDEDVSALSTVADAITGNRMWDEKKADKRPRGRSMSTNCKITYSSVPGDPMRNLLFYDDTLKIVPWSNNDQRELILGPKYMVKHLTIVSKEDEQ